MKGSYFMDYPNQFVLDGVAFPYDETITPPDEEGAYDYLYEISVVWEDREAVVSVYRWGVSLWYDDGDAVMTNLEPNRMFPNRTQLSVENLKRVIRTLESIKMEGMHVSKERIEYFNRLYLRQSKDD